MKTRQIVIAAFMLLGVTAQDRVEAWADEHELNICARVLTQQIALAQGAPVDYRIDEDSTTTGRGHNPGSTWHLDARHPKTNEVVARIDCTVDSRDRVLRLTEVPLAANDAHLRAVNH